MIFEIFCRLAATWSNEIFDQFSEIRVGTLASLKLLSAPWPLLNLSSAPWPLLNLSSAL